MSSLIIHVLAVYDFHFRSIPFQELRSFLTLTPDTTLHFHSNHTLQHPRLREILISISQAPFMQSVTTQALFQPTTSGMFYFPRRISPNRENPFGFDRNGFFFQKYSKHKSQKDKYNKDFLSIIFTDKK